MKLANILLRYRDMLANQASTVFPIGISRIRSYFSVPRVTNGRYTLPGRGLYFFNRGAGMEPLAGANAPTPFNPRLMSWRSIALLSYSRREKSRSNSEILTVTTLCMKLANILLRYRDMLANQASTAFPIGISRIRSYFSVPRVTNGR
jgi:hypothetical protein